MTKQEFLSMGLKGMFVMLNNKSFKIYGIEEGSVKLVGSNDFIRTSIKNVTPIIRHLDTLTQECVQADYNDGKPFVPIVELAKIAGIDWIVKSCKTTDTHSRLFFTNGGFFNYDFVFSSFSLHDSSFEQRSFVNQLDLFQHLIKWHFWPNKQESEDVVYVTEEFNPYE